MEELWGCEGGFTSWQDQVVPLALMKIEKKIGNGEQEYAS